MPASADADRRAVEAVIEIYLDGLYEGDADKLATAFHPSSALAQMDDGKLQITPRDTWISAVRTRPSPKARGLSRHDEIVSIDITGPTMAFVKVKCAIPPRFFTDQLSLLKIDGRWQVAQKVFQTETR